jgi:hypothetical protein
VFGSRKGLAYGVRAARLAGLTGNVAAGVGRLKTAAGTYRHFVFDLKYGKQFSINVVGFSLAGFMY